MDYKEKYEMAVKAALMAKQYTKSAVTIGFLEEIFPELKESEDERIRKAILELVRQSSEILEKKNQEQMIAWLEKQGEQKLANKVEPKFKIGDFVKNANHHGEPIYEIVGMDNECYICEYRGNKSMGDKSVMHFYFDNPYLRLVEQKPAWSEEDEERLSDAIFFVREYQIPTRDKRLLNAAKETEDWLRTFQDRVQPKQEWSEEDLSMIGRIRSIIEKYAFSQSAVDVNGELCEKEFIDADNWLKSLKDRVQPQPKQEWTMQDEEELQIALDTLVEAGQHSSAKWLKNVCLVPQSQWKPSELQMKALESATENCAYSEYQDCLRELMEQLKKLIC